MKDTVLGPWGWLIVVAVLASVLSSTQTTILPTARGTLSMAVHGAIPPKFGDGPRAQPDARVLHPGHGGGRHRLLRADERFQRKPAGGLHQLHQPFHRLLLRPDRLRLRLVLPCHPSQFGPQPVVPRDPAPARGPPADRGLLRLGGADVGSGLRRHADLRRRRGVRQRGGAAGAGRGAGRRLPVRAVNPGVLPAPARRRRTRLDSGRRMLP